MSETAKSARAAMKAKAQRLGGSDRPLEKVDSSSWSPPELLNSTTKTGARPLTRRAYKSGGKVKGPATKARADRPARKTGDASLSANSLINRNVKAANAEREGAGKHVGGFKNGGSTYGVPAKMRLLKTHTDGDNTAKVYKNPDTGEHQVKFYKDGVHQSKADYFADDPSDAHETAQYQLKRGLKRGGRAEKCEGGEMKRTKKDGGGGLRSESTQYEKAKRNAVDEASDYGMDSAHNMESLRKATRNFEQAAKETGYSNRKSGGRAKKTIGGMLGGPMGGLIPMGINALRGKGDKDEKKNGGRAGKFMGGPMMQPGGMLAGATPAGPSGMPAGQGMPGGPTVGGPDPRLGIVAKNALNFGAGAQGSPYKKGGAVKHLDVAADKALIKKMVKSSARTGKMDGGGADDDSSQMSYSGSDADRNMQMMGKSKGSLGDTSSFKGIAAPSGRMGMEQAREMGGTMNKGGRAKHAKGGEVFSGKGYPFKVPGADGGRTARASGGRATKGKTNINIVIAAGKGPQGGPPAGLMPPPPSGGGRPVMMPPPPPGGAGAGAPPMPMPIPMPMPMGGAGGPPPGMPPMPRKAGGRITKTAHSYKDMEAGAGSGEGRLQKTEIAKRSMHNSGGKVGHRSYRSYKDMDAGSGGGLGRLEKTEIAAKHSGIQKAY